MKLNDARERRRRQNMLYLNHRSPPWLAEDSTRAIARTARVERPHVLCPSSSKAPVMFDLRKTAAGKAQSDDFSAPN
jgi:hypothetical protein